MAACYNILLLIHNTHRLSMDQYFEFNKLPKEL